MLLKSSSCKSVLIFSFWIFMRDSFSILVVLRAMSSSFCLSISSYFSRLKVSSEKMSSVDRVYLAFTSLCRACKLLSFDSNWSLS